MSAGASPWEELERPGPDVVLMAGVEVRRGSRVILRPRPGGDVFDVALAGRIGVVEGIEQDMEENLQLAVVLDDDPGRDLGQQRQPGHRFFFSLEELEPLAPQSRAQEAAGARVLVAGIGNVFLGDDGFGVALAGRLAQRQLPAGVEVVDFGIRGIDLAYAMQDGYDVVVMLDATPRGGAPGTLYVIEAEVEEGQQALDAHGMDPVMVLSLVKALGGSPPRTLVVGCEPQTQMSADEGDVVADLSEPVRLALDEGVTIVESLLADLTARDETEAIEQ